VNIPGLPSPSVIIGTVAVVTLLGAAVWVQTSRLETAQLERAQALQVAADNRKAADDAVAAKTLADKTSADRVKQEQEARADAEKALRDYRATVKGETNACHFAVVDPAVDRLLERADAGRSPAD